MKTIKLFEEFNNHKEIDEICKKYNIKNYTINEDGSIDVNGNVNLSYIKLTKLPLRFNKVSGDFFCNYNKLTTLEGSPNIVSGYFNCSVNKLNSLEGCPTSIGGEFYCLYNPVYEVWKLIDDKEYLELFLDYDIIDGDELNLTKLNDILDMMGRKPVTSVEGYKCI